MKHILTFSGLIAFIVLTANSCSITCLPGEGAIVTQEVDLDLFSGIHLDSSVDVDLSFGKHQKVEVIGHENHIALLERTVSGDIWKIDFEENVCTNDFKVNITIPQLTSIDIDGSGDVRSETPLQADNLELGIDGSGSIDLQISAKNIDLYVDGSGDVQLKGNAQNLEADLHGSGDLDASDIMVEDAEISIDGSGDATVNVSETLDASISGSGSIKYKGSPKVNSSIKGSGEVIKD